ncbi:MAG: DUF4389 domain-containing protein [Candidatus Marinimicrobia bacterium]|nr:DUF4389 domain-containing protein [Candidatus Neomarinimicrobiota bacterium]MBT5224161.1 DUF4389 domain-containing protein [Candidatus Neomarinimicrobiota bacterium]
MNNYPATLTIDYPENANRITVLFRLFLIIPILIILVLLSYHGAGSKQFPDESYWVGILVIPTLLMIVFRQKYPKWWFDWNEQLIKFSFRIMSYVLLLQHEYPSTDEDQGIHIKINYPNVKTELNRWMPLVKWLLVFPHLIVLFFLMIGVFTSTILAWVMILISGKYPKKMFNFVVGTLRWILRVQAYALLLITDKYPPFSLSE